LREARQRAGFANHDAVAKQLGLTREGYGRLERGRIMPRADVLLLLGRLFGVSVDWLLGLSDEP
jgi:transcriptional regulator with XRE-family HTH domain